jgi:hypothetical protein
MADAVSYFLDEHISNLVRNGLSRRGVDVTNVLACGRVGFPDVEQLRYATLIGRVLVTNDDDYLAEAADFLARGEPFGGVAYAHPDKYTDRQLLHQLLILHGVLTAHEMRNNVEYL